MIIKNLLTCLALCLCFSLTAMAQPPQGPPSAGGAADAQVESINRLNNKVNERLAKGELYNHRINLNSSQGVWPGLSSYTETVNYYFTIDGPKVSLKKVIVLSKIADRQSYTDFLFDAKGNVSYCLYNHDVTKPQIPKESYHFLQRKMISATRNDETRGASEFVTEDVESGAAVLEQADAYKKVFMSLVGIQLRKE